MKAQRERSQTPRGNRWDNGPPKSIKPDKEQGEQEEEQQGEREIEDIRKKLASLQLAQKEVESINKEAVDLMETQVKELKKKLDTLTQKPLQDRITSLLDRKRDRERKVKTSQLSLEKLEEKQKKIKDSLKEEMEDLKNIRDNLKELGVDIDKMDTQEAAMEKKEPQDQKVLEELQSLKEKNAGAEGAKRSPHHDGKTLDPEGAGDVEMDQEEDKDKEKEKRELEPLPADTGEAEAKKKKLEGGTKHRATPY